MTRTPKYSRHRSGGRDRACVKINGRRHYLGTWGTTESRRRYHELIAGHLGDNPPPDAAPVARAEPGVIGRLLACDNGWCEIEAADHTGWLPITHLWGVYDGEVVE